MVGISEVSNGFTLLCIGDWYNKKSEGWKVVCYFTDIKGAFYRHPLSIDLLPLLIVGETYPLGKIENSRKFFTSSFVLPPKENWQLLRYEDMPESLKNNRLLSKYTDEISRQWVYRIESAKEIIWIPVIELAKALFLQSSEIVRAAVLEGNPHQLAKAVQNNRVGEIMFESHTPLLFINSKFYRQLFAWLMFDDAVQASFGSIYRYLNQEMTLINNTWCWSFKFLPPNLENCSLTWRGYTGDRRKGEHHHRIINEIRSLSEITTPELDIINYSHPNDKSTYHVEKEDEKEKDKETTNDYISDHYLVDSSASPKYSGRSYTIKISRSGFHFDSYINMQRAPRPFIPEFNKDSDEADGTNEVKGVSVAQGTRTGTTHRADTDKSEKPDLITPSNKILLFEEMLRALTDDNNWTLTLDRGDVPREKCRSAHLINKRARQYSFGKIKISDGLTVYALEIELKDKEALSTLLYKTKEPDYTKTQILTDLMSSDTERNQKAMQWDRPRISDVTSATHFLGHPDSKNLTEKETCKTWAEKAKNKLLSL